MCSSGTEATMSAIRLARGFTGRDKIIKFEGCYHGHSDSLLVKAGSGRSRSACRPRPACRRSSRPTPSRCPTTTRSRCAPPSRSIGTEIACVIVEPVAGNMNCIPPVPGFLEALRELCTRHGALLIFDEVMTGFRVALGGAQALYGITPGPDHARQDRRRRHAGRRLRRARATSWSASRRSGPSTRPARCPATRSRWPRDSRRSKASRHRASTRGSRPRRTA